MRTVTVVLHRDPDVGWWADSPDVEGWTAADPDLGELRTLIQEGLEFFLDQPVSVDERVADGPLVAASFSASFELWQSSRSQAVRVDVEPHGTGFLPGAAKTFGYEAVPA